MNMFKSNGGFTLVELIVVIAILAILAGIAVPAYSGYISKANEAADLTLLGSIKTAVDFEVMENDPEDTATEFTVAEGATSFTVKTVKNATGITVDISEYVDSFEYKSNNASFTWTKDATTGIGEWEGDGPAATTP